MDHSPAGSSVHGTLQARTLEWVAIPSPVDLPGRGIELKQICIGRWMLYHLATWEGMELREKKEATPPTVGKGA